jgi:hypothetical protein
MQVDYEPLRARRRGYLILNRIIINRSARIPAPSNGAGAMELLQHSKVRTQPEFCEIRALNPLSRHCPIRLICAKEVTFEEVLVSAIATNDALAKLLIAKGIITEEEFNAQLKIEWARYLDVIKQMHTQPPGRTV